MLWKVLVASLVFVALARDFARISALELRANDMSRQLFELRLASASHLVEQMKGMSVEIEATRKELNDGSRLIDALRAQLPSPLRPKE